MSRDEYRGVGWEAHTLLAYPCGVNAGARLRLKRQPHIVDHRGKRTGEVHEVGDIWTVLPGLAAEPRVVWLREPGGDPHTWDDEHLLEWFEAVRDASA